MFTNGLGGLGDHGGLGELLEQKDSLFPGNKYTFTFEHNRVFEYNSEGWVLGSLREKLSSDMSILIVDRPLFSTRYAVTFTPKLKAKITYFLQAFQDAWKNLGYSNVVFIQAETDIKSTSPGGLTEITQSVGEGVGSGIAGIAKPLTPYLILLGGLLVFTQIIRVEVRR